MSDLGSGGAPDNVGGAAVAGDTVEVLEDTVEVLEVAERLFGVNMPLMRQYADILATVGVERGLLGPREAPRMWGRHLINCEVIEQMIPSGVSVTDIGSGAGLPGIVLAVVRPDLRITLVEPLARRATFLMETIDRLGLPQVRVHRGRAEDSVGVLPLAEVVTARAVAPLDRLAGWCLPLTLVGGRLLAFKGVSAADEVQVHGNAVRLLGGGTPTIHQCGADLLLDPATVVQVVREREIAPVRACRKGRDRNRR